MKYAKQRLSPEFSVLIPTVYAWESTPKNPVGQPYILMERMKGRSFDKCWKEITLAQKRMIARQLAHFTTALHTIGGEFTEIGNIYYNTDKENFYIGPYVDKFLDIRWDVPDHDAGPWSMSSQFFGSQVENRMLFGHTCLFERTNKDNRFGGTPVGDIVGYLMNLYSFCSKFGAPTLENVIYSKMLGTTTIEKVAHSATRRSLFHDDLNEANILIDPTTMKLTGIIDWEGVGISPEWMAVSIPRCFDGPDAYSPESQLGCYDDRDKIGLYIEKIELRSWYMMERCGLEPGFSKRVRAYAKLRKLWSAIDLMWNVLDCDELPKWVDQEMREEGMI